MWPALCIIRLNSGRLLIVLAAVVVAVLVWACSPASFKTKLKKIGHAVGNFQARVLLTAIYSILILPFGLLVRVFSDSLHTKKRPEQWFDHPSVPNNLDEARRQG